MGFEELVAPHRRELYVHCYRMLGSVQDAEDALQDSMLAAWRGFDGFEGRSSVRAWLYRICTNTCLRHLARRPPRVLSPDHGPAWRDTAELGEPVPGPVWLEPLPDEADDPANRYLRKETVELAFVAALQHLPATQRAVLILREVLEFSAAEVADLLETTPAAVNSALQRARATVAARRDAPATDAPRELVDAFVRAWERADVPALLELLTDDARFTMPPLPAWFAGRHWIERFLTERLFATEWRLRPFPANGQPGFACYSRPRGSGPFTLGAVNVLRVTDGRVVEISGFLDPELHKYLGIPLTIEE